MHNPKDVLRDREEFWIKNLRTQYPFGLNSTDRRMGHNDNTFANFRQNSARTKQRGLRKGRSLRRRLDPNNFIIEAHQSYNRDVKGTLNRIYRCLFGASKESIKRIYFCIINRNSSRVDHFIRDLCSFRIQKFRKSSSQIIHDTAKAKTHSLNVHYTDKSLDFLNFNKIFKIGKIRDYIPADVPHEMLKPKIRYSYEPPSGLCIFNYKKIALCDRVNNGFSDLQCLCYRLKDLINPFHKHVITGSIKITDDPDLRQIFDSGPKYRLPCNTDWNVTKANVMNAVEGYVKRCEGKHPSHENFFREIAHTWNQNIELEIRKCSKNENNVRQYDKLELSSSALKSLKRNFVITVTDKAPQNYGFICKKFYVDKIYEILSCDETYELTDYSVESIRDKLTLECKRLMSKSVDSDLDIPFIQLLPKFHKNPVDFRVIIASKRACTKPISKLVSNALKLIDKNIQKYCEAIFNNTGVQCYWVINNNKPILDCLDGLSKAKSAKSINTFDFGQMYTNLHHTDIFQQMHKVLTLAFGKTDSIYVNHNSAMWSQPKYGTFQRLNKFELMEMIRFVVSNTYFQFGGRVYKQVIGIPMGTDCAPWIANLTLFAYEFVFLTNRLKANDFQVCRKLRFSFRYIDDISVVNDDGEFERQYRQIYPSTLTLKKVNSTDNAADVLDVSVVIKDGKFVCNLYDKRESFPFKCNVFPNISSNISDKCKYNIFYSQLFRFCTIITDISDVIKTTNKLLHTLVAKGYMKNKLINTGTRFININRLRFAHKFTNLDFDAFHENLINC